MTKPKRNFKNADSSIDLITRSIFSMGFSKTLRTYELERYIYMKIKKMYLFGIGKGLTLAESKYKNKQMLKRINILLDNLELEEIKMKTEQLNRISKDVLK